MVGTEGRISIGILGVSGYTGGELARLLARHPKARIAHVTSEKSAGKPLSAIYPHLYALGDLTCQSLDPAKVAADCEMAFLALPHAASMAVAPALLDQGCKVVDLSADFRLKDPVLFQEWYDEPHHAPALLPEAVYGLPELRRREIVGARLVANPGCYPTSVILPLTPLLEEGLVEPDGIVIDSKSGVSGAGRTPSQSILFAEVAEGFNSYKTLRHRHTPEIEQELSRAAGRPVRVRFTPHLLPQVRGILSTCYLRPRKEMGDAAWGAVLKARYQGEPFVHVLPPGGFPSTSQVRASNGCVMGIGLDTRTGWLVVISAIDNLVKGASGQAIQNMNLMYRLEERTGLEQLPVFP